MVCVLAFGTTLLRETFNLWMPTYFVQFAGFSPSVAASRSALFPLCGGISVLLGGFLSDKLGPNGRNILVVAGMSACTVCLVLMGRIPSPAGQWAPSILVGLVGFTLLGPYSYLAGAMSLDFGGEKGSATAAGIIDGFGYMAGWLSGDTVARIAVAFGWRTAFLVAGRRLAGHGAGRGGAGGAPKRPRAVNGERWTVDGGRWTVDGEWESGEVKQKQ